MISSCFRSSFLSDLFCSHSELKLVANIKLVAAKKEGTNSTVGCAYGYEREVNGSNHGGVKCFFHPPYSVCISISNGMRLEE